MSIKRVGDEDCSLLERIQRGDDRALALLYDRYAGIVYSIALRVLCDPALAEQILSDIFLEIWRRPERFMQVNPSGLYHGFFLRKHHLYTGPSFAVLGNRKYIKWS